MTNTSTRNFSMDLLRVLACFLVINQHCAEVFYGSTGHVEVGDDTFYTGFTIFLGRTCVPLFTMISGYFLLPMKDSISVFFRKRATRVVWPFLVWAVIYAVFFMFYSDFTAIQSLKQLLSIFITFPDNMGHFWYVYMLLGLYLLTPIISPWLEKASRKQLRFYLAIWLFTTLIIYLHRYVAPELWGECFWNPTPTFYYFTGFAGYFVLGYYIKRFGALNIPISIAFIVFGYAVCAIFFSHDMFHYSDYANLEVGINFCTLNVVLMTWGIFSLFTHIRWTGNNAIGHLLTDYSQKSYGIYLGHMIVLSLVHLVLGTYWPQIFNVVVGSGYTYHRIWGNIPACLVAIPVSAVITFVLCYVFIKLLSYLHKSHKYLVA